MIKDKPALFLDRDGILLAETGSYVWQLAQSAIRFEIQEVLRVAARMSYPVFIVTNQGGINKGLYSFRQAQYVNHIIESVLFKPLGIKPQWFVCPHHPSCSRCWCRKPDTLFFERIIKRFNIKSQLSVMVGDQERDLIAARSAGLQAYGLHPSGLVASADRQFATDRDCALAVAALWECPSEDPTLFAN